jgi:hypothetical protein
MKLEASSYSYSPSLDLTAALGSSIGAKADKQDSASPKQS